MIARQAAERIAARAGNFHRALVVDAKLFAAGGSAGTHARPEVQPFRVAADERLRKDDEPGAAPCRVQRQIAGLPERSFPVEQDRSGLHHSDGYMILSQSEIALDYPVCHGLARSAASARGCYTACCRMARLF